MQLLPKAVIALLVIWGLVAAVVWTAGQRRVTPERIAASLAKHPLNLEGSDAGREKRIREIADQINQLDYEQRQAARQLEDENGQPVRAFFEELRPGERALFIELTIGATFTHLMKALNEMSPEERKEIADRTIGNIRENGGFSEGEAQLWQEQGPELFEKVVNEGLRSYYEDASASTKLDFAPVLEAMQTSLQSPRGRWKGKPKP